MTDRRAARPLRRTRVLVYPEVLANLVDFPEAGPGPESGDQNNGNRRA